MTDFLLPARCRAVLIAALLVLAGPAQAAASLEIAEFGKPGEKRTVPLNSEEPLLFNIEFFSGWSHCEVAAGFNASARQSFAWMRCFSLEEVQIALACSGNERQTVVLGRRDDSSDDSRDASKKQRGSLALVCRSD